MPSARRGVRLGPLALVVLVGACAKTNMTSLVNPVSRRPDLRRVAVVFETSDPGVRRAFEHEFGQRAGIATVDFIPSYTLFPPERPMGPEEFGRVARENRLDAFLLYTPGEAGVFEQTLPTRIEGGCVGWILFHGCDGPTGARTLELPWTAYTVMLVEPTNMGSFWTASATTEGRDFANWEDLRHSLTDETIERLLKDGVIR